MFDWPEAVVIDAPNGAALAGLRPRYMADDETQTQVLEWHEGGHVRIRELARVVEDTPERFVAETTSGELWTIEKMTLERYRERVREHTVGKPDFETEAEMLEAMRREW